MVGAPISSAVPDEKPGLVGTHRHAMTNYLALHAPWPHSHLERRGSAWRTLSARDDAWPRVGRPADAMRISA